MTIIVRCNFGKLAVAVSMTIAILFSAGRAIAQGSRIGLLKPTSAQKPAAISAVSSAASTFQSANKDRRLKKFG
ncbi:hypothetical protein [Mesorhizobium mediterraneum]|uniref:hypothetical protein n=1 Tax=Mesorhizobium mediterraneum TaxID=43617 RepID=UPI00177AF0B8|nr:hypothetical protein [Mesorhizobium mediterraneum]